jgi:hypothetical protein
MLHTAPPALLQYLLMMPRLPPIIVLLRSSLIIVSAAVGENLFCTFATVTKYHHRKLLFCLKDIEREKIGDNDISASPGSECEYQARYYYGIFSSA